MHLVGFIIEVSQNVGDLYKTGCNKMHDERKVMKDHKLYTSFRPKMTGNEGNSGATAYTMRINIL